MGDELCEACSICLSGIEDGSCTVQPYLCRHRFHDTCISRWNTSTNTNNTCPYCRAAKVSTEVMSLSNNIQVGNKLQITCTSNTIKVEGTFTYIHVCGEKRFLHLNDVTYHLNTNTVQLVKNIPGINILIDSIGSSINSIAIL